jgi:hypothetical protein
MSFEESRFERVSGVVFCGIVEMKNMIPFDTPGCLFVSLG